MVRTYGNYKFLVEEIEGAYDISLMTIVGNQYIDTMETMEEVEEVIYNWVNGEE